MAAPAGRVVLRRLLGGVRSRFFQLSGEDGRAVALMKLSLVPDPDPAPGSDTSAVYGGSTGCGCTRITAAADWPGSCWLYTDLGFRRLAGYRYLARRIEDPLG